MTTTNPEGGDRLSIGDLQRKDAAKPFAERDRQRLTEAEIKQIIRRLPKPLSMTPLRIGVEISGFARDYLQMRRKEEASRPASRVQRDLKAVVSQLDKVVEWANGHKRRLSTDIPRLRKGIKQLEELANDESAGVALSLPLDEAVVPALKELQRVLETTTEKTNAPFDLSKTQDLRDFIRDSVAPHVEEIRDGKTSRRRSAARGLFLDRLANLYFRLTGKPPTFQRCTDKYKLISAFGKFAKAVFDVVEPEFIRPVPRQRVRFEDDIHAAVIRFSPAPVRFENDIDGAVVRSSPERRWCESSQGKNIAPLAADPRDRKLARGRL